MLQAGCHSVRSPFYIFKNDIHDLEHGLGSGELCHESAAFGSEDNLQYLFRSLGYIVSQLQTSGIVSLRAVRELLAGCFCLNGGSQAKRSAGVLEEKTWPVERVCIRVTELCLQVLLVFLRE